MVRQGTVADGRLAAIPNNLQLTLHHDEDVKVYLNGKLILEKGGHVSNYETHDATKAAADALQQARTPSPFNADKPAVANT